MATAMSKRWVVFLSTLMIAFTSATIIEASICNATGEYYFLERMPSEMPEIMCDGSKSNTSTCYIGCSHFGCTQLNLTCTSDTCNIYCDEDSCERMNIASTSKQINLYCYISGCDECKIQASSASKLNMICDGSKACQSSQLTISNLSYYTNITCDGELHSKSCSDLKISIPYPYEENFISFNFNNNGDDSANPGSADNIIFNCIGQEMCGRYTKGPIISTAQPIITNKTGVYYMADNPYTYRWQHIICDESQNCYINCSKTESCYNSYIECKNGSNCHIYCDKNDGCSYSAIRSTDKTNTKIQCDYYYYIDRNLEIYLFEEGCLYTNIESAHHVTLTCSRRNADNSMMWISGGCQSTIMKCTSGSENSCNLICPIEKCQPTIHIPSSFKNGFLTVSGDVDGTTLQCAEGINTFQYNGKLWNYSPCMPWNGGDNINIISCSDKTECIIYCNENDKINIDNPYFDQYGCSYQTIAGSQVKKLSVICDGTNKVCKGMDIFCGMNECEILCEACSRSTIHAADTELVNITTSFPSYLTVNATNAGSLIFRVPVDSVDGDNEAYDITIYAQHADYVQVGDVIRNSDIYAQYADRVDINCTSMMDINCEPIESCIKGCNGLSVDVSHAGQVNYQCNNKNGCKNNDLYAQYATELNITALSNVVGANSDIMGPAINDNNLFFVSENTNLFCQDNGCANATFYSINGLQDINTIWNGTCECGDSLSDCITQWTIYCGDNNKTYSKYNGECMQPIENAACCEIDTAKLIKDDFDDYYSNDGCVNGEKNATSSPSVIAIVVVVVIFVVFGIVAIICYVKIKKGKTNEKEAILLSERSTTN